MRWSAFGRQQYVMKSNFPLSLKRKDYNTCISSVLTYGAENFSAHRDMFGVTY